MFRSATLKLTAWYAGILVTISVLFSVAFFQLSLNVVDTRLVHFQGAVQDQLHRLSIDTNGTLKNNENHDAASALLIRLAYVNLVVLIGGTIISYLLARYTLKPVEEAHLAQARFVSDASHELRTPLAVMKSELEVSLRDKSLTKQELRHILKSNLEEVENLANMSDMLLAMSRMDHQHLEMQAIDLKLTVAEAMYRFRLPKERLQLTGRNVTIMANETSLSELISILIDNALKYSPTDTAVRLHVGEEGDRAVFSVTNAGEGIPNEALEHVFDRFYRADSSRTTGEKKGFGLGLAIAHQIADLHKGEITATSAPGDTTVFRYYQDKIKSAS